MAISSPGLGSGLDVQGIVSQLVALERKPLAKLQSAATFMQTQISAYGQIQSLSSGLRDAAAALAKSTLWQKSSVTSSDTTTLTASASGAAAAGNYSVTVTQLARTQTLASSGYADANAVVGAGKLTLELGRWDAGVTTLTPKSGTSPIELDFTDPSTTLAQVRDRINAANAGVTAAIVTDVSGARLTLASRTTGLDDQIKVTATDSGGNPLADGLAHLQYPPSGATGLTQRQAATNALATINGVDIESTSNTVSGALDGITLSLVKAGGPAVTVTSANDSGAQRKAVQDFVTAYNALNNYLLEQTKYDETAKVGGSLQGDSTAVGLRNQMRALLGETTTASTVFTRLSQVGLDLQKDGTIKLDTAKLDKGLTDVGEVAKLFSHVDTSNAAANGMATRFQKFGDAITSTEGSVTTRNAGLQSRLKRNEADQQRLEERVERTRERLLKQYQSLDAKMNQLNSLSAYVAQQMSMLNNQFSSGDK